MQSHRAQQIILAVAIEPGNPIASDEAENPTQRFGLLNCRKTSTKETQILNDISQVLTHIAVNRNHWALDESLLF